MVPAHVLHKPARHEGTEANKGTMSESEQSAISEYQVQPHDGNDHCPHTVDSANLVFRQDKRCEDKQRKHDDPENQHVCAVLRAPAFYNNWKHDQTLSIRFVPNKPLGLYHNTASKISTGMSSGVAGKNS